MCPKVISLAQKDTLNTHLTSDKMMMYMKKAQVGKKIYIGVEKDQIFTNSIP